MFTASMTGSPTVTFSGNFTTNVVVSCSVGRPAGFQADLSFDNTLGVTAAGLNGATVTQGGRLVVEAMGSAGNGVNNGTSVLRLTVRNNGLRDGQTGAVRLTNVRGTCIGPEGAVGHNAANMIKNARWQQPAPRPDPKPCAIEGLDHLKEDDQDCREPEHDARELTSDELVEALRGELPAERRAQVIAEVARRLREGEERIIVLESQIEGLMEAPVLGEHEERTGLAALIDNKWVFLGFGALMAGLVAAAIAIVLSLAKDKAEP